MLAAARGARTGEPAGARGTGAEGAGDERSAGTRGAAAGEYAAAADRPVVTGLERYRLAHRALPGRDLAEIGLATPLMGAVLAAPLLIAAPAGASVGRLARAASEHGLGLVVGDGGALLSDPGRIARYRAPDRPPLLLASIALAGLLDGDGPERAERLVEMLDADGLVVELDVVGAAIEPGGDPRARRAEAVVAAVVDRLAPVPVMVRETGSGMDGADARALGALGVAAVDIGGAGAFGADADAGGGRAHGADAGASGRAAPFADWGVPVADAVAESVLLAPGLPVVAGGPLRDGVEVAVCLALGATAACLSRPFARAAPDAAAATAAAIVHQLRVAVWAAGAPSAAALGPGHLRVRGLT